MDLGYRFRRRNGPHSHALARAARARLPPVQCAEVEPNRGELWCRVAKSPKSAHDKMDALLKKVGARGRALHAHWAVAVLRLRGPLWHEVGGPIGVQGWPKAAQP